MEQRVRAGVKHSKAPLLERIHHRRVGRLSILALLVAAPFTIDIAHPLGQYAGVPAEVRHATAETDAAVAGAFAALGVVGLLAGAAAQKLQKQNAANATLVLSATQPEPAEPQASDTADAVFLAPNEIALIPDK